MIYNVIAQPEEYKLIPKQYRHFPTIITGVGAINVTRALQDIPRQSTIRNYGYAGSTTLKIGETVEIKDVRLFHPIADYDEVRLIIDAGTGTHSCYSSTDFVTSANIKDAVFDMELAFIALMGFEDVRSFKTISDNCNYEQYKKTTGE